MTQIERIGHMERILDEAELAVRELACVLDRFEKMQRAIDELEAYYTGDDWKRDYDDDCAGRLPDGLKRGVLSEDAVDHLLLKRDGLLRAMKAISG